MQALWLQVLCLPLLGQAQPTEIAVIDPEGAVITDLSTGVPFGLLARGQSLTSSDRIRVVSESVQCGNSGSASSVAELVGLPLAAHNSGQDVLEAAGAVGPLNDATIEQQWSNLVIVDAGQYRICYCLGTSPPCDSDSDFQQELGLLQVLGPATGHAFRCAVGWPCEVGPVRGDVMAGSRLRLMTSCNPPIGADGFLPGSDSFANETDSLEGDPMISDALPSINGTFSWGSAAVVGPGQRYEMCWCAGGQGMNCTQVEDFLVSIGSLEVPGPTRPVSVLCTAGRLCHFSIPAQHGVSLGNGDRVLVSPSCGAADSPILGWPNEGISDPATDSGQNFQWSVMPSNSSLENRTLPEGTFVASAGMYRLCWCHRETPCINSSDFRFDVGSLTFAGPLGNQSWICTRGQSCALGDVLGTTLSVDDRYLVQEACGSSSSVDGFEGGAALPDSVSPVPSLNSTAASVRWSRVMATVGEYKLCWAPSWQRPSNRSCSELSWDATAAGLGSVCASSVLGGGGQCEAVDARTAGLRCGALGARLCLAQELAQGEAAGASCATSSPSYWTARACGESSRVAADERGIETCQAESEAVSEFLTQAVTKVLACCADEPTTFTGGAAAYFATPSVYAMPAGQVIVRGPFVQDASCVSGEACSVRLQGLLLNATLDRLLIVKSAHSCGNASSSPAAADFGRALANGTSTSSGESATFALGTASTFATFRMCWCSMIHTTCELMEDFGVYVGDLLVGGIDLQVTYCTYSLPCTVELRGTNLGQVDGILLSPVGETCGTRLSATPEVQTNPAVTTDMANRTVKAFSVGIISRLDAFQVCYCINFGNRACTSGGAPVYEHFSMAAGTIEVRGPRLNATLDSARAGVPYRLSLSGRLLNRFNRITVLRAGGPACGTEGSNESGAAVLMESAVPVSVYTDGTQEAWDVTIMRSGDYYVCWCSAEPCNNASSFSVMAASLPVDGLLDDRDLSYPQQIVGNPFPLLLQGHSLRSSDRAVLAPAALVSSCGAEDTHRFGSLSQRVQGVAPSVFSSSETQAVSQLWLNARVSAVGEYLICWCGRGLCSLGSHFNIEAARVNVTGPPPTDFPPVTAGEPFTLVVRGTGLGEADRISIVDMSTDCGTPRASSLASTIIDSTGTGMIGPPAAATDALASWSGLAVRWQGLYRVCWAGNHSSSQRCLEVDEEGACVDYQSAHFPHYLGNLRVDYGNISLAGQTSVVRCDSLDVVALPPQPNPTLTASYAVWACEPRDNEICDSLHFDFLDVRAKNLLSLHIPADIISSGLDRANFWATGRGEDPSIQNISLSVTMIDSLNITRQGSLAVQLFAQAPLVVGVPREVRIGTRDQLFLALHAQLPGGFFCEEATAAPAVSASWRLQSADGADLAANNTASSLQHLILPPSSVADLGVGVHSIVARVAFGGQWAAQDVAFRVEVRLPELPAATLAAPGEVPQGCPIAVGAAAPGGEGSSLIDYRWSCSGPQGAACTNFTDVGALGLVKVFELATGSLGLHSVKLSAKDGEGSRAETTVQVDVQPGVLPGGQWPVAVLPMPEVLGADQPITCAATAVQGMDTLPMHCTAPAEAVWSLLNLTAFNNSEDLSSEDILDLANGTELSIDTQQASMNVSGYPVVTFAGTLPSTLLQPGGRYRCVLRALDAVAASTGDFRVAEAPKSGWLTVAPRAGTALQTQFTLESTGWYAEHLPLQHAFLAFEGSPPPASSASDAARFLRGWASASGASAILGIVGPRVNIVARVRDTLGSTAQASTEVEVAAATGTAAALAALGSAWWPPDPRTVVATAAAVVLAISPDDSPNSTAQPSGSQAEVVARLLDALHAASGPAPEGELSREDLGLQVWVLERTLQLAVGDAGPAAGLSANSSLKAAAVLERVAAQSATAPPEPATASRFVAAASALVTTGVSSLDAVQASEVLQSVRGAERHLGNALYAGMRQGAGPGGPHFARSLTLERAAAANMSLVIGWAASASVGAGIDVPAEGLQLQLPALAARRLNAGGAAGACSSGDVRVQLTRWPRSPVSPPPLSQRLRFEGPLQGLRAATEAEAGALPQLASLRLWGCSAAAWQGAGISLTFAAEAARSFEVDVRNGSEIQTSRVEVSWACAQWDATLGQWRLFLPAATAANGLTVSCASSQEPSSEGAVTAEAEEEDGYVFLAALPVAQSTFLRSAPAEPPPGEPERVLAFWRLWGLGIAVLAAQTLLLAPLVFYRPSEGRPSGTAAEAEAGGMKPSLSDRSMGRELNGAFGKKERWCVLLPTLWLCDGLCHIRPWRLCSCSCRRRRASLDQVQQAPHFAPGVEERSVPAAVLRDGELSLSTEPGLRSLTLARAREALQSAERALQQKVRVAGLGAAPRCCGLAKLDLRERHYRWLLLRALDLYRDLARAAVEIRRMERTRSTAASKREEGHGKGLFESKLPAKFEDAVEEEALNMSVAHYIQEEVLRLSLGEARIGLSANERESLSCFQEALRRAMDSRPPVEKPTLLSAFAPPVAVAVQLLSIDSGHDQVPFKPGSKPNSDAGSRGPRSGPSTPGSGAFAGVVPQHQAGTPRTPHSAWSSEPSIADLNKELGMEEQPYILGATYFLWLHGRALQFHRAGTALRDPKAEPQVLDHMLSIHEVTRGYTLDEDVQELATAVGDDRLLILRLRRGPRLRWRVAGDVHSWTAAPQGPPQKPPAEGGQGPTDLQDVIHGAKGTVLQSEDSSCFFYKLRRAPHTANSLHLETVAGLAVHAYMWYSHGGAAISFTFAPSNQLMPESDLPGTPGEDGSHQDLAQAIGIYTSDIISLEHIVRPMVDAARSTYFQTVMTLRDRRKLRLCYTSRFARLTCQTSILTMRDMVFPDANEVDIRGHGSMAFTTSAFYKAPDDSAEEASPDVHPAQVPPGWKGLRGYLEVKILSASGIGLTEPPTNTLAVASKAFGVGPRAPAPKPRGKTGMPSPRVFAYVRPQPPPYQAECRRSAELPERTSNPIWNYTWNFTTEYSEDDAPPGDLRLEVWDTAGVQEFLGEVTVPFPHSPQVQQYHLPLQPHKGKMAKGETRVVNGTLSFQLRWRGEREVELDNSKLLSLPPFPLQSVCGVMGISLIRGWDLRSADFLSSDPYCVIHVSTAPKTVSSRRTETRFNTLSPVWEEVHEFPINWPAAEFSSAPVVKIELWDFDHVSSDEFLGEASFQLPSLEGCDVLDLELVPNRSKGAATVKGHIHVRLYFHDEFHPTKVGINSALSPYEQTYCTYFGRRPVDDQLARVLAPQLCYFHFGFGRVLRGQLRRSWHLATCGLVDPGPARLGGAQARLHGYLALSASLWAALAAAAGALAAWEDAGVGGAVLIGVLAGLLMPDLAHILAQLLWHDPRPPSTVGIEAWQSRGAGDPPVFAIVVLVLAWCCLAACLVLADEDASLRIALAAGVLVVVRLLVLPLMHGLLATAALNRLKSSSFFDWIVWYFPSMLTAHTAAL